MLNRLIRGIMRVENKLLVTGGLSGPRIGEVIDVLSEIGAIYGG